MSICQALNQLKSAASRRRQMVGDACLAGRTKRSALISHASLQTGWSCLNWIACNVKLAAKTFLICLPWIKSRHFGGAESEIGGSLTKEHHGGLSNFAVFLFVFSFPTSLTRAIYSSARIFSRQISK